MFCVNCGKKLNDDALFCTGCGAKLTPKKAVETVIQQEIPAENTVIQSFEPEETVKSDELVQKAEDTIAAVKDAIADKPVDFAPPAAAAPIFEAPKPAPVQEPVRFEQYRPAAQPVPPPQFSGQPQVPQQGFNAARPVDYSRPAAAAPEQKPVSTGLYFLLLIVSALPVVGLITSIICLASAKNRSFKNFCKAAVILGIIYLVIVIACAVLSWIFIDELNEFIANLSDIKISTLW